MKPNLDSIWDNARVVDDEHIVKRWSRISAGFAVMEEAYAKTTGNGQYHAPARNLYYVVREMIQQYTDEELTYEWFTSPGFLPTYRRTINPLPLIYYDPRGELHEPHTGTTVPLGTREVEGYSLPKNLYNKMLYIEKKGFWPPIKDAKLAERYDMAVVVGQGYAVEAARTLFQRAKADGESDFRIFVLHDADPYGYDIARTLSEATKRMPGYSVDVEDLGLSVGYAIEAGLPDEEFTDKKELITDLIPRLDETEREWFTGQKVGDKSWIRRRVELNAFLIPDLLTYIEDKLQELGATEKVIPSDDILTRLARDKVYDGVWNRAYDWLTDHFEIRQLASEFADSFIDQVTIDSREWVTEAQANDPTVSWNHAIEQMAETQIDQLQETIVDTLSEQFGLAG